MVPLSFPDPPLQAQLILLRAWSDQDVPAIVAACSDPATARFIPTMPAPYTERDAREWLACHEQWRSENRLELAIAAAGTDVALGAISARVDTDNMSATVGYWLTPAARGHGHMTAALRLLCGWLFETLALGRIALTTDPENHASANVAQRCGFQQEGLLRSDVRHLQAGQRRDSLTWGLLPGELTRA